MTFQHEWESYVRDVIILKKGSELNTETNSTKRKTHDFCSELVLILVRPHGRKKKVGDRRARISSDHSDVAEQYAFCTNPRQKAREGIYLLIFVIVS